MTKHEIPCPMCCKNVQIPDDLYKNGGIATCRCGYRFRLTGVKNRRQDEPQKKRRPSHGH